MLKIARIASAVGVAGLALGIFVSANASPVHAKTTSDKPAAILIWPKVIVDTSGVFTDSRPTDTLIQLSNTATGTSGLVGMKQAHCFYIDATSHCANNPSQVCQSANDCTVTGGGFAPCVAGWQEIDFDIIFTKDQPLAWHASEGERSFPLQVPGVCDPDRGGPPGRVCTQDSECAQACIRKQSNIGSGIPPVPEDPFLGSLECIEFDPLANPAVPDQTATSNTLKGEGTIESRAFSGRFVDIQEYNAVGVQFKGVEGGIPSNELHLDGVQYEMCPTNLIVDQLFDQLNEDQVTDLTLVPCGNDFLRQRPGNATAQFLVFNEFEQRFSTSKAVDCFFESQLSLIDTPDPHRSIFSISVAGTLAGQTRIRPVGDAVTGRGLVGVARLLTVGGGAAYNLHQNGDPPTSTQPDIITLP